MIITVCSSVLFEINTLYYKPSLIVFSLNTVDYPFFFLLMSTWTWNTWGWLWCVSVDHKILVTVQMPLSLLGFES